MQLLPRTFRSHLYFLFTARAFFFSSIAVRMCASLASELSSSMAVPVKKAQATKNAKQIVSFRAGSLLKSINPKSSSHQKVVLSSAFFFPPSLSVHASLASKLSLSMVCVHPCELKRKFESVEFQIVSFQARQQLLIIVEVNQPKSSLTGLSFTYHLLALIAAVAMDYIAAVMRTLLHCHPRPLGCLAQ